MMDHTCKFLYYSLASILIAMYSAYNTGYVMSTELDACVLQFELVQNKQDAS